MSVRITTIKDTLEHLTLFFFNILALLIQFGTYEQRKAAGFRYYNEIITYLCDGTVQKAHETADLALKGNFFSAKNNEHAVSLLLFTSPEKRLLHLTPCIYGCVKDDDLLIQTASN